MPSPAFDPDAILAQSGPEARRAWWPRLVKITAPVLEAAAAGKLRARLPVEAKPGHEDDRAACTHLEAVGRTLAGLAPWLACEEITEAEERAARDKALEQTLAMLAHGADPHHPDAFNLAPHQALVDATFLAEGLLRGFDAIWPRLDRRTRDSLVSRFKATRQHKAGMNNWLLFSAMVEAFLHRVEETWESAPVGTAIRHHLDWYKGDGAYGDGEDFHWDYYNSFVIHPMLLEVLEEMHEEDRTWMEAVPLALARAARYAQVQERAVAPDGSFAPLGRSLAYRCGAFHLLAKLALDEALPVGLPHGQARAALQAAIARTLDAPGTFDSAGWLRTGLAGHQPSLAEPYISTGSLYLCTVAFLPLGLPAPHPFWTEPSQAWTALRLWRGEDLPPDHALVE